MEFTTHSSVSSHIKARKTDISLIQEFDVVEGRKDDYKILKIVGKGNYGVVFKALKVSDQSIVALKFMTKFSDSEMLAKSTLREISILKHFSKLQESGRYVTRLLDSFYLDKTPEIVGVSGKSSICLVLEYIPTTLERFLKINRGRYPESIVVKLIGSLLRSLHYLHSAGVVHRDIKPANLLVTEDLDVVICDFGFSRTIPVYETVDEDFLC